MGGACQADSINRTPAGAARQWGGRTGREIAPASSDRKKVWQVSRDTIEKIVRNWTRNPEKVKIILSLSLFRQGADVYLRSCQHLRGTGLRPGPPREPFLNRPIYFFATSPSAISKSSQFWLGAHGAEGRISRHFSLG